MSGRSDELLAFAAEGLIDSEFAEYQWKGTIRETVGYAYTRVSKARGFVKGWFDATDVYVLSFTLGQLRFTKIGISQNVSKRIKQLETTMLPGTTITVIGKTKMNCRARALHLETALLFGLRRFHISREWLQCSEQEQDELQDIFRRSHGGSILSTEQCLALAV